MYDRHWTDSWCQQLPDELDMNTPNDKLTDYDEPRLYRDVHRNAVIEDIRVQFHRITATEFIAIGPILIVIVIIELMTIASDDGTVASNMDYFMWFIILFISTMWTLIVIIQMDKQHTNTIMIKQILSKHLSLFISGSGVIVALIGTLGIGQLTIVEAFNVSISILFVIFHCAVLVMLDESFIEDQVFKKLTWIISKYGKAMYITNVLLIFNSYLHESYELQQIIGDGLETTNVYNLWHALAFCFFFWKIEFHLACIERIHFID